MAVRRGSVRMGGAPHPGPLAAAASPAGGPSARARRPTAAKGQALVLPHVVDEGRAGHERDRAVHLEGENGEAPCEKSNLYVMQPPPNR